jgi:hypothetical protein
MLDDAAIDRLVALQAIEGAAVFKTLMEEDYKTAQTPIRRWKGVIGGFLPTLPANAFTPGIHNKIFSATKHLVPGTTSAQAVSIIERGWASWVKNGGVASTSKTWEATSPFFPWVGDAAEGVAHKAGLIANEKLQMEDLTFIDELMSVAPPEEDTCKLNVYSLMQYKAIVGARADLSTLVDDWHVSYVDNAISTSGQTITGFVSVNGLALQLAEDQRSDAELVKCRGLYRQLLTAGPYDKAVVEAFKEEWLQKGYATAHNCVSCCFSCACVLTDGLFIQVPVCV